MCIQTRAVEKPNHTQKKPHTCSCIIKLWEPHECCWVRAAGVQVEARLDPGGVGTDRGTWGTRREAEARQAGRGEEGWASIHACPACAERRHKLVHQRSAVVQLFVFVQPCLYTHTLQTTPLTSPPHITPTHLQLKAFVRSLDTQIRTSCSLSLPSAEGLHLRPRWVLKPGL